MNKIFIEKLIFFNNTLKKKNLKHKDINFSKNQYVKKVKRRKIY